MTETTIYNQSGLSAKLVDGMAVSLYLEEGHTLTMTVQEWASINAALGAAMEGMRDEQV